MPSFPFDMFIYEFMQKALLIGVLLGVIIPCIGIISVLRRLSMTGDALSHSSLAGVAIGLVAGINPVLVSILVCIASAFLIEFLRRKQPKYSEMSIAIVMSMGIGIAGIMSSFVKSGGDFQSYLFGSILSVTDVELYLIIGVSILVALMFFFLYKELMHISFDEGSAKLAGIPVGKVNFAFTLLSALTIAVAAKTVGALVVSSVMVLPVAVALQFSKSYKMTVVISIIAGIVFILGGLVSTFYFDLKPGGSTALIGVVVLVASIGVKSLFKRKL